MVISGNLIYTNQNIPKPASLMPKYDAFYVINRVRFQTLLPMTSTFNCSTELKSSILIRDDIMIPLCKILLDNHMWGIFIFHK